MSDIKGAIQKNTIYNISDIFSPHGWGSWHDIYLDYDKKYIVFNITAHGNELTSKIESDIRAINSINKAFTVDVFMRISHIKGLFSSPTYGAKILDSLKEILKERKIFSGNRDEDYLQSSNQYSDLKELNAETLDYLYAEQKEDRKVDKMLKDFLKTGKRTNVKLKIVNLEKLKRREVPFLQLYQAVEKGADLAELHKFFECYHGAIGLQGNFSTSKNQYGKKASLDIVEMFEAAGYLFDSNDLVYKEIKSVKILRAIGD